MATILIADDHEETVRMLEILISSYTKHQTITARNGRECVDAAPRADLILMDIRMPALDGIGAFESIRSNPKTAGIPIIFMTAYPDQVARKLPGDTVGTIDYLLKPINQEQLVQRIKVMLGIKSARDRFQKTNLSSSDQFLLLLTALEQSADGVTVTGWDGSWLMINNAQARMFGYTVEEFLTLKASSFYRPASSRKISGAITKELEQNDRWEGELEGKKKNGEILPLLVSLSVVKDNRGEFLGIMGITKNISELKSAYQELRTTREALIRSERMKAVVEMTRGLSHDFNNLLASILGNTQLLMANPAADDDKRRLAAIERAAQTAARNLRRLQRLLPEVGTSEAVAIDLVQVVTEALAEAEILVSRQKSRPEAPVVINKRLRPVPSIQGSVEELKIACLNLILNAFQSLPQGGEIKIFTWKGKSSIFIRISDNGVGMSREIQERAFEPFVTTRHPTHSGLGLSDAYGIVLSHRGRIRLRSQEGRGTSVTICLPLPDSV